jgi:hypothetical protein
VRPAVQPSAVRPFPAVLRLSDSGRLRQGMTESSTHLLNRFLTTLNTWAGATGSWMQDGNIRHYLFAILVTDLLVLIYWLLFWS